MDSNLAEFVSVRRALEINMNNATILVPTYWFSLLPLMLLVGLICAAGRHWRFHFEFRLPLMIVAY
jgi:hypothetical protein